MINSKRHLYKTITWRFIASSDTVLITWLLTENFSFGLKIGFLEILTKMILYYFHEIFWFKSSFKNANKRHILKTFSWRTVGTMDTIILCWLIIGDPLSGLKIGFFELFSKMFLYYGHERIWYKIDYGLENSRKKI